MQDKTNDSKETMPDDAKKFLNKIRNKRVKRSIIQDTVPAWVEQLNNNELKINHKYQRKGNNVWKPYVKKGLLLTVILGDPMPPFILGKYPGCECPEMVDGQQRINTLKEFYDGNLSLPTIIPHYLGGGRSIRHTHSEILQEFDRYVQYAVEFEAPSFERLIDVYTKLQRSARLTLGQKVRGKHGQYKDLIDDLAKNKKYRNIGRDADNHLQFAAYLVTYIYKETNGFIPSFKGENVDDLLFELSDEEVPDIIRKKCFVLSDILTESMFNKKINAIQAIACIMVSHDLIYEKGLGIEAVKTVMKTAFSHFLENWMETKELQKDEERNVPTKLKRYSRAVWGIKGVSTTKDVVKVRDLLEREVESCLE